MRSAGRTVKTSGITGPVDHAEPAGEIADADDEVGFWLRFIDLWQRREGRPATDRMRDALAYAQARQRVRGEAGIDSLADGQPSARRYQ